MAKTKGTSAKTKAVKPAAKPAQPAKLAQPAAKSKPAKKPVSTRVTTPLAVPVAPAAPAAPPQRDELPAPRDIGRLLRYGERFGANKIDTRMAPATLPVPSGALAICDPTQPKSWRVLDRPSGTGQFRVMLGVAKPDKGLESLAALVIHTGRPPIARWTVAHARGQKKPKPDAELPTVPITSRWLAIVDAGSGSPGAIAVPEVASGLLPIEIALPDGRRALAVPCPVGDYTAYWAVDAGDKPICLVIDFDAFTQKEWKAKPT